ncbi:hypothetical protein [Flavisericum labens]|uniref:hypothetical protein n=1 Tax=Flavisericum labens TaxID=3377112 RepID=UPI00387B135F
MQTTLHNAQSETCIMAMDSFLFLLQTTDKTMAVPNLNILPGSWHSTTLGIGAASFFEK